MNLNILKLNGLMNIKFLILILATFISNSLPGQAKMPTLTEKEKIEALISSIEHLKMLNLTEMVLCMMLQLLQHISE